MNIIRKVSPSELLVLNERAIKFAKRHNIDIDGGEPFERVMLDVYDNPHLYRLWVAVIRRVTREPNAEKIAYGFIGY